MTASDTTNIGTLPTGSSISSGPLGAVLQLFSSIWLGIWLLVFLFIYCSIGSIGIWLPGDFGWSRHADWIHDIYWMYIPWTQLHIRQAPGLEMTEFEWFHWWPFYLNILLICINVTVATLRRIPLNVVNLGVWMIHTGIVILCIGSVIYFGTKLEGDAPIVRRDLIIEVPEHRPVRIAAQPGSEVTLETARGLYHFFISNIDPHWELLSGDDAGEEVYAVQVRVRTPQQQFIRTLPAGYPEYVQDAVRTNNPEQPMARAINEIGRAIVDDSVKLSLAYSPAERFYLMQSNAIYLREKGTLQWIERPIHDLPRYNDYIEAPTDVWLPQSTTITAGNARPVQRRPLHIEVHSVDERDPLAGVPLYINRYLRYAFESTRRLPGGDRMDPAIHVRLQSDRGQQVVHQLVASDPTRSSAESGRLAFIWVRSRDELAAATRFEAPTLQINVPDANVQTTMPVIPPRDADTFTPIEGTPYAYQVLNVDSMPMQDGRVVSVAIVRIRTPERTFQRWVFDHPDMPSRDLADDPNATMRHEELAFDESIQMRYNPGHIPAPVTIIAGPETQQLSLLLNLGGDEAELRAIAPDELVNLEAGISMQVLQYWPFSRDETRPQVVAPERRERNADNQRSMIRVELPVDDGQRLWLSHHVYPFRHPYEVLRRFPYRPKEIRLADGRVIEIMYSRRSHPLPARIALDDFQVTSHIGGFTGQSSSIRDWTSIIRFDENGTWTDPEPVSMNKPANYRGFWFFQAKWDPPDQPRGEGDPPSRGLNYTVLGVGNRNGVWTQLFGCVVAVIGMCYAFYVKPMIKRRRQQAVYEKLAAASSTMEDSP